MTTATFAVLDKTFSDSTLPQTWQALRDQAYSRANLRAAAQAYNTMAFEKAKGYMAEAVRLNPELCANDASYLADLVAGWANFAKTSDPLRFLEDIYDNLPDNLDMLRGRRRQELGREAMQLAFESYNHGDLVTTRSAIWRAIQYQPGNLANRGAISIFFRSWLGTQTYPKN